MDWPRWRGPEGNSISRESGWESGWPKEGLKVLWKASVGIGFSSVTVSDGRAFTLGNHTNRETLFCFDSASGEVLWKFGFDCLLDPRYYDGGPSSSPTIDGKVVFIFSRKGHVHALDTVSGRVVWSRHLAKDMGMKVPEWGFAGSPWVEGDLLILNAGSAGVALQKQTGQTVWVSPRGESGYSSPIPWTEDGKRLGAWMSHRSVVCVELTSGKLAWEIPWKTDYDVNAADVVRWEDWMVVSSGYHHGAAGYRLVDHKPVLVWTNREFCNQFSSSIAWNGFLFGVDGDNGKDGTLKCLEIRTGIVRWGYKGKGVGSVLAVGDQLVVQWENGELVLCGLDPAGYREMSRAQVLGGKCWTPPVLSHGRMYCRNAAGRVVCLDVRHPGPGQTRMLIPDRSTERVAGSEESFPRLLARERVR